MRPLPLRWVLIGATTVLVVLTALPAGLTATSSAPTRADPVPTAAPIGDLGRNVAAGADAKAAPDGSSSVTPSANPFSERVLSEATALARAGVPSREIRLPYAGAPATVVDGAVVPTYAAAAQNVSISPYTAPVPFGVAYYGENDTTGHVESTVLDASSVAGELTVNSLQALYLDVNTPDMWGIQLNAVLTGVSLGGAASNVFWTQNAVDVFQHNSTINLGEDTWNFSNPDAEIPNGTSTILDHSPNGSIIAGLYIGEGPWLYAPAPFTLTLYLNSSLTAAGDQELWYNYSLSAAGGIAKHGTYDWVVFNPGGASDLTLAPFQANGEAVDPVGLPNDYELDYGIGGYNGATMDVLAANTSAALDYCPATVARCTPATYRSVPAALDFGSETGETGAGLSATYVGTTENATAGPTILRGLWGYAGASGATAGAVAVTNAISTSGAPDSGGSTPYVFVFLRSPGAYDTNYEWAPDVTTWYLAPGAYDYQLMLSDYAEQTGVLVVSGPSTTLTATLAYSPAAGVYTPLWAFSDAQLPGISSSGTGGLQDQYRLFNDPTDGCALCGGAANGNLSPVFFAYNDYAYPVFTGLLLDGTSAYVQADSPPSFSVAYARPLPGAWIDYDLQIAFVDTSHVTLANASFIGGWPAMFEVETLAGAVPSTVNLFPQASVELWDSTDDLIAGNTFVPTVVAPPFCSGPLNLCTGAYLYCSYGCVSPDALLLYGGTDNTIWGNTIHDPVDVIGGNFTGIAEAESGDLIYNNNLSVDNPTILLPYDLYADSCPDGYAGDCGPAPPAPYADRWNVTVQPAGQVSATVDGDPLSGSILGAACPEQGGNFWSTYGDSLNPYGQLPMVNRFNYSLDAPTLGPGASVEPSLRSGGDAAPLLPFACLTGPTTTLTVHVHGLPSGAAWSLVFTNATSGKTIGSTARTAKVSLPEHHYTFAASGPAGYGLARVTGPRADARYGALDLTRAAAVTLWFGPVETVTFTELVRPKWPGLPSGTSWSVALTHANSHIAGGANESTTGTEIQFRLVRGATYTYWVDVEASGYQVTPVHGHFTVPGHAVVRNLRFRADGADPLGVRSPLPASSSPLAASRP